MDRVITTTIIVPTVTMMVVVMMMFAVMVAGRIVGAVLRDGRIYAIAKRLRDIAQPTAAAP